jgi:cation diffusion facilitator CzcD-associated flavoprotein CzcO
MARIFASDDRQKQLSQDPQQFSPAETAPSGAPPRHVHVAILGTGFSGLGIAIRLKQQGSTDFVILERAADAGGTWRDNTYPGCACDVPSHLYSFSFAPNPDWSHVFSTQPEIWDYLRNCTRRFGLEPYIQWNSELLDASWQEDEQCWSLTTRRGQLTADILILGNGPLSEPALPAIPGIQSFEGNVFHSAQWDHAYDLTGKRVAVIGTGASAIQFVPQIQPLVEHLTLFQRTPPWIMPRLDHPIPGWQKRLFRLLPLAQRLVRCKMYLQRELLVLGFVYQSSRMKAGEQLALRHLERQVADPKLREKLTPRYTMGCKRILLSNDFYPALTQPNVELVTERIREIRTQSIVDEGGREQQIDTIICGTGFHVTEARLPQRIHGRAGQSLADRWQDSPDAYLGTTIAGFPNLFLMIGPNTGLGHNSMVFMIESQINYILDCLRTMRRRKLQSIDVQPAVQTRFNEELQKRMAGTVWTSGCTSWYLAPGGRNTTLWPGFTFEFRRKTRHFDAAHYTLQPVLTGQTKTARV